MKDWGSLVGELLGAQRAVGAEAGILSEEDFRVIDRELTEVLRTKLTMLDAFGPVVDTSISGAGITEIETYKKGDRAAAVVTMTGEPQPSDARVLEKERILAPVITADTVIPWRIREAGSESPVRIPLLQDLAADIAAVIAQKFDDFVPNGDGVFVTEGFMAPTGRTTSAGNDWSVSADNVETDVLAMLNDLDDNDIGAEGNNPTLFVHTDEAVHLRQRFGSGSDTTVRQHLLDNTELERIVVTKRQTAQTAAIIAVTRDNLKLHILEDMQTEQYTTTGSRRSPTILGGWMIPALKVRHAEAFIERTSL